MNRIQNFLECPEVSKDIVKNDYGLKSVEIKGNFHWGSIDTMNAHK